MARDHALHNILLDPAYAVALKILDEFTRDQNYRATLTGMEMTALALVVDNSLAAVRAGIYTADDHK